jgi:hypothetical protein
MLKWLADLAYILRGKEQVDWTTLEREARQVGCYRMVLLGFGLAHDLLGASLPDPILYRIHKDNIVQKLISIHRPALLHNRPLTNLDAMRCEIRGRERFRDHFKASWGVLSRIFRLTSEDLPPGASMQMKAKAILWRPVRLCRDFGWKWLRDVFELH